MNPGCPVYDSIELLQEKWVLHIVRALLEGPHGFNELGRAVGGANTTTLSQRLDHLERLGLVSKTIESTMPPPDALRADGSGPRTPDDHRRHRRLGPPPHAQVQEDSGRQRRLTAMRRPPHR